MPTVRAAATDEASSCARTGPANAAAATTTAIETVVVRHLVAQRAELATIDPAMAELIASIVEDEALQHDRALDDIDIDSAWLRAVGFIAGHFGLRFAFVFAAVMLLLVPVLVRMVKSGSHPEQ